MTKYFSLLAIFLLLLSSCEVQNVPQEKNNSVSENKITVEGKADNAKMGAIIITDAQEVYYVGTMSEWDDSLYGKRIRVTGILDTQTTKAEDLQNEKGEWTQGMIGDKNTLLSPEFEVIE